MTPPQDDVVEISVFGPGYGESILIHVGSRRWIVIDSCLVDDRRTPAPLKYMSELGLDASADVCAVVATHWHDDHIKGLSTILHACTDADFWYSAALTKGEFLAFLAVHDKQPANKAGSRGDGDAEMHQADERDWQKDEATS
ncbi:MAG: MBL fold metallo-hydrolase [Aestuariivita sp.]|nr:MBL fold metallo-hydrolase [Aestuariivita sp.]MCY4346874.1 MBL fold metallo-hydrolase [Aestuariivita sp.]